ncbi:MAG TPA: RICIN domain-containing protein [Micromonosporaceae bacterium]|nr:RICIN domain-containing protein [Micromonosporaceae bacterium]
MLLHRSRPIGTRSAFWRRPATTPPVGTDAASRPTAPVSVSSHRVTSRRRLPGLLVAAATALVATGLTVVAVQSAQAATIDTNASYVLVNRHSGKAIDVSGAGTADGAAIIQWTRTNAANQQWRFVDSGGGYYRLRSVHSGKVLDVSARSTLDGANVVQWADTNGTNQQFQVVDTDSGYVKLINRNSGKALETWELSLADGARVSQFTDFSGAHQQWQLVRVGAAPVTPPTGGGNGGPTTPPASYPGTGNVAGDTGVHDPEVVKTPSGTYLLAATGNGISLKTSTDRITWRNAGSAFSGAVSWAHPYTNNSNHLWAPDISYVNGRYYMYYSASTFGSRNSAIFLATSTTGAAGSWTNQGLIVSTTNSSNHNAIDPNLFIDGGRWWLTYGSFWTGIKMIELDPTTGRRTGTALHSLASNSGGIEAPTLIRRGNWYYLFVSFDACCRGAASTYRIMVGRSASVTGPFVDRNGRAMISGGGNEILAGRGSIHGPGHQAVLEDNDGYHLFYHWYANNNASHLGINRLGWDSAGWPFAY